ncbi:MAG: NPCBM/NEW2 domain-containing protein [Pirellulales bacterium]|nr:NPCBM/NEW2 domain-containing protein [Pirellulales bacterium]
MDTLQHSAGDRADVELWELASRSCNDALRPQDVARLESLLAGDPRARQFYGFYMLMHGEMAWRLRGERDEKRIRDDVHISDLPPLSVLYYPLSANFIGGPVFSYMVASVVLCLMLLGAWAYKISHVRDQHYAADSRNSTTSGPLDRRQLVFVGRITGMKDCRWADPNTHTYIGASAPLGREYALASGLMEITYKSGAKVILEGPCSYKVESSAGGFLTIGKLTAKIGTQSSKPKTQSSEPSSFSPLLPPLFAVRTPTAIVTDLGTEFGVEVAENGDTTSHVFEGKVVVEAGIRGFGDSVGDTGLASGTQRLLEAGESVQVSRMRAGTHHDSATGGTGSASGTLRFTHPTTPPKFVRRVYEPPKLLDLLDIVAGGDGMGRRRERGIDPQTGKQDSVFLHGGRTTDRPYAPVEWNSFVDGVFIPKLDKTSVPVQLDSDGHAFDGFTPYNSKSGPPGRTAGSIWARAVELNPIDRSKDRWHWIYTTDIDERFMPDGRGLLCMQSNSGITFDLAAVRRIHKDARPARFRATVGMIDAEPLFADKNPQGMTDVWVFVDGHLKQKRMQLRPRDGISDFNVTLGPQDRFLTLVITDSANGAMFDWVVWGDPVLETTTDTEYQTMQPEQPAVKGGATIHNTNGTSEK